MWMELNENLINLDHAIEISYEDGELVVDFEDGSTVNRAISNEKWQKIRKVLTQKVVLLNQDAEMVYTFPPYGCGGKGRTDEQWLW